VGEAPGRQEEEQGRPFVGAAGKNLSEFLDILKLKREEIYITNTVKFRPSRPGASGKPVNRTPSKSEIEAFLPWLQEELETLRPNVVVTLGNTALQALWKEGATIGQMHGKPWDMQGWTLFPLYHPASIIYNRSLKERYLEDLSFLASFLQGKMTNQR